MVVLLSTVTWRYLLLLLLVIRSCESGGGDSENKYETVPTEKAMPPLMDPIPQLPAITHRVFFDVSIQGEGNVGRIVIGLFGDNSPAAVQQFVQLCSCQQKPCFTDSLFHRIIPYFGIQGGDVTHHDGTGGVPLAGKLEMKETVKMTQPHLLAVATKGTTSTTATSQFFITTVKTQWLTGKHVVLGMVLEGGDDVVDVIVKAAGTYGGIPHHKVTITQSGVLPLEDEDVEPHYY